MIQNADPLEPSLPDYGARPATAVVEDEFGDEVIVKPDDTDEEILALLGEAKRMSRTYQQAFIEQWEHAESAYRSEHSSGSKYRKDQYRNRARYFKPKTRAAVRKGLTATRAALFSSQEVVAFEPENDSDPKQVANAALLKEIINARFNNKTIRSGVPWFQIAIGARKDTQVLGVCASKQEWVKKTRTRTVTRTETRPVMGDGGAPVIDFFTRQPATEEVSIEETVVDVIEDKPVITLFPAEMILIDPTAGWINPVQNSPTLIVPYPMRYDALKSMMEPSEKGTTVWRVIDDESLRGALYSENELMGLKSAREGDKNTAVLQGKGPGRFGGLSNEILDVWECFYRKDGEDFQCWTLRDKILLSDPMPTGEAYPALRGARPYVMGTDVLEPHVIYPESHVHSWKQAQDEINDFTNIRMDATRLSAYPTAKVKAGRNIDYKAVQRRDQMGVILVREENDVTWDRPPGPGAQAYQEANLLANDFDELAGGFSQGSVQSNRQLNETVGGMQIIAANAGATNEFDLAVWIDTWVEPVISQIVMLEQYYEDDATIIAVAGNKAKLWERYGVDNVTDELLESQVSISLNIGVGGSDPMMKLMKFKTTMDIAMPFLGQAIQSGKAEINYPEIASEIFGQAGYRNGAERFVTFKEGEPPIPPEQIAQMQQQLQALQAENEQLKNKAQIEAQTEAGRQQLEAAKLADREKDRQLAMEEARLQQQGDTQRAALDLRTKMQVQNDQQAHEKEMFSLEQAVNSLMQPSSVEIAVPAF